jgi:uncharacterized SAM-binding protein YcdF (DUF218 family)
MEEVDKYAKIIWDYMLMHQKLEKADVIFILGSNDLRVADRAVEIFKEGWGPFIVCSGGNGKASSFNRPEAEMFAERASALGVPDNKIILEPNSTNTGENVLFTKKLLQDKGFIPKKIIAIQKPHMERRTFATIKKQWSEVEVVVTSPQISYEEYSPNLDFKNRFINTMVGDLLRIEEYPKLGFQIPQEIPEDVWQAGQELIKLGYDKYAYIIK